MQWAVVADTGTLLRGTATGATRIAAGDYRVTFSTAVNGCGWVATPLGDPDLARSSTLTGFAMVSADPVAPQRVIVQTFNRNGGNAVDLGFSLIVAC